MYEPKDYGRLIGTQGFSDTLLTNHFTLYQGYVKNTNTLLEKFQTAEAGTPEFAELRRRFGWEFNGMRLHEYYFENMTKEKTELAADAPFTAQLIEAFGSFDKWLADFKASGTMRGIGWTILYYDSMEKRLVNTWITEHDAGHMAGCKPLLVLDVFEHAYVSDYGLKRADYIDAFMNAVDWNVVANRLPTV